MLAAYAFFGKEDSQNDFVSSRITNPRNSNVYGYSLVNKFFVFPAWKARVWQSFCLMFNNTHYEIFLNGEAIVSQNEKATFWGKISDIKFFSHKHNDKNGFFGALTDLNVWNRSLSNQEVKDFSSCQGLKGNHVPWSLGSVQYHNMLEEDLDMAEICQPVRGSLIIGSSRTYLSLAETQGFCAAALGGRIAVADSRDQFEAKPRW